MSLTRSHGPLSVTGPKTVNYRIDGPAHRLLAHPFPRRVRAEFAGRTVLDTRHGVLVHESALLPRLYVPETDIDQSLFVPSEHTTHCPFKGDATYRTLRVGDRVVENALWAYPDPTPAASWLAGYASLYWEAADAWFDEDEPARALTDPYHRVDVRRSAHHEHVLPVQGRRELLDGAAAGRPGAHRRRLGLPGAAAGVVADRRPGELHARRPAGTGRRRSGLIQAGTRSALLVHQQGLERRERHIEDATLLGIEAGQAPGHQSRAVRTHLGQPGGTLVGQHDPHAPGVVGVRSADHEALLVQGREHPAHRG